MKFRWLFVVGFVFAVSITIFGQTTALKYQGKLNDGTSAANGNYFMQFRLFDSPSGGSQLGTTISDVSVNVVDGIFSAQLDFGAAVFSVGNRYLEISVKRSAGDTYTTLFPREQITSSPFSVRTLSAAQADFATTAGSANTANSANTATNFTGNLSGDVTGTQTTTTVARLQGRNISPTAPTDGQVLKYNAATSQWRPDTDATASGSGGISGVTAGTGLTGGGTTGNVTVGIANSGVTNALLADGAVTAAKVSDGAIATVKLADSSVTDAKINSISGSKVTGAVANSTNATTAVNFTGPLAGDVTGTQSSTTIANSAVTNSKIADSSITAPKIAPSQVVKSLNTLKDDVTLAAGTNITITPAGNTLTIAATGSASGVTGSGTTGRVPLFSGPTSIGDSLISQTGGTINMPNVTAFAPSANGYFTQIGSPNSETGVTFAGSGGRADIRYNGALKIVNGPGGIQGPSNGISISNAGNVGVGTDPNGAGKMQVLGGNGQPGVYAETNNRAIWGVTTGGSYGVYGESSNGTGIGVQGVSGSNIGTSGGSVSSFGVFGSSTSSTGVRGNSAATNTTVAGVHGVSSGTGGIGVKGEGSSGVYGTSTTGTGVYGESTSANGFGVYAFNPAGGRAFYSDGNAAQPQQFNGLPKAMLYVNPFLPASQYIVNCYNGVTGQSSNGCGFNVIRNSEGFYLVGLGSINPNGHFLALTIVNRASSQFPKIVGYAEIEGTNIRIDVLDTDEVPRDTRFWLIVF